MDTQTYKHSGPLCVDTQTRMARRPSAPVLLWVSELGSLMLPPATCLLVERDWGSVGNLVSVFTEAQLREAPLWPSETEHRLQQRRCEAAPVARVPEKGHPGLQSATLGPGAAALTPAALRAGWEAQSNQLAEISRASYLPKPACSHKSQNRVPGRDVNSEMQRQLQRKIVEKDRQESCLLSPQVSERSLEQARAFRGHRSQYHPLVSK